MTWPVTRDDIRWSAAMWNSMIAGGKLKAVPEDRPVRKAEFLRVVQFLANIAEVAGLPPEMHPNDIGELTEEQKRAREFGGTP